MDGHDDEKRPATGEKRAPIDIEGAPAEEGVSPADAAARLDLDPEDQVNRPEQPDADPAERRQFE
ncbi:MAG TPA: hypothetical protein VIR30_20470 [Nocardioides sp.]